MVMLLRRFGLAIGIFELLSSTSAAKIYLCGDSTMAEGNKDVVGRFYAPFITLES
jgi:hypothetical protein